MFNFFKRSKKEKRSSRVCELDDIFGGSNNAAGVHVDEYSALSIPTVYACINVISEDVAKVPFLMYRESAAGVKDRAKGHALYRLLKNCPNRYQTPFEFFQLMTRHALLRHGAFAEIVTSNLTGQVTDLIPLNPDRVRPFWAPDGSKAFAYTPRKGGLRVILEHEMFHIRRIPKDGGLHGMTLIECAAETMGMSIAVARYGSKYFSNDATPGVALKMQGKQSDEALARLKESWAERKGVNNAHKPVILEEGLEVEQLSLSAVDSQFIETRKMSPIEICQFIRVPPHKVQILDRATFSNIEHQSQEYYTDTLLPWFTRYEQAAWRDLLTEEEKNTDYYFKFLKESVLQADTLTRYRAHQIGIQQGFLNRNEVRGMEDKPPFEGGDDYLTPMNMTKESSDALDKEIENDGKTRV